MRALIPDELLSELNQLQQKILTEGLAVLILFEGSSGRVIGRVNSELIRCLEPRGVVYGHFDPSEAKSPASMLDFLKHTPCMGQIGLFDRSWYSSIVERYNDKDREKELEHMLGTANRLERYLTRNGVLLIKIFLRSPEPVLKKYGDQYGPKAPKRSFLSLDNVDPAKYREVMLDRVYSKTDTEYAPWDTVHVGEIEDTVTETVRTIMERAEDRLRKGAPEPDVPEMERIYGNPRRDADTGGDIAHYENIINDLSEKLAELQMSLSLSKRSLIVCFEGWDAAGKGSGIKHLCHALNPRGYAIYPTKAPSEEESKHTYLWRFLRGIPEKGHITVYDRTWYGRMMVEPIEGFCTEEEYERSPAEINAFEKMMADSGVIIVKFWLDISSDEQLKRFEKRKRDPLKQWKLTDEDWRNRLKWDEYSEHVDAMIESTNTEYAPWTVVDANNKKYARVKILETVAEALERELKD